MPRFALKIEYDGTHYVGYQVQKNGPSVQAELERSLRKVAQVDDSVMIPNTTSGRTDAGVHALGQVIHVDFPHPISAEGLRRAMNSIINKDIRIIAVVAVDDQFHARYSAQAKEYLYRIDRSDYPDPFKRYYTLHHPFPYNLEAIKTALDSIVGTHDFTSFCSSKTDKEDKVRTIYQADVWEDHAQNELCFRFYGNGFLYNMVRILVGTLLQIGDGLRTPKEMREILHAKDRNLAGPTAGPSGLYLVRVEYPQDPFASSKI